MSPIKVPTESLVAVPPGQRNGAENIKTAEDLLNSLQDVNVSPLWAQMARLNPALPNPSTIPFTWEYDRIRPYLLHAGNLIKEEQAERRVLMLVNPEKTAPYTTDTLYAGLQLVMPHETAPAHRHSAFAVRFIIEGKGGFTAVQGRRVAMNPRDVLVTPPWNWHDHGKKGAGEEGGDDSPVIWLDGLDLPEFVHFPVHFNEHYSEPRYPAEDFDQAPVVFPWSEIEERLNAQSGPWATVPYLRANGAEIGRTVGALAERLDARSESPSVRETASSVYHVVEGIGHTTIGEETISWKQGDTFCIPAWYRYQHFADDERVYLYRFHDKPMLQALGFYRQHGQDPETLVTVY
ncbi:probable gentisate 1,2-dioxygenase oxidoreductase [Cephalotrichum gorgonifer]|uniref:Probable gentisate 1,2-dioxygenase oxidoreductase n=1 Tax=Cephalotrichum gorgonifer TaxID=2041049 RepID=A0AAE8N3Q5_9PEZI|nr:probable gentisate 1,2-dioxygenase oxidoreductase [Cephalotrichum gorgonifer]